MVYFSYYTELGGLTVTETEPTHRTITIYVNNRAVAIEQSHVTGAELKEKAGVPADFALYVERGGNLVEIGDTERIEVHPDERFRAVSGQDVS